MKKERKFVRKESVVTYLFIFVIIGVTIGILYSLNLGLTGFAVFTEGPGEGQTTLKLQDADTENLEDVYVDGGVANKNRGIDTDLQVQKNPYQRVYIKFDISQIPANQIINDSKLCLYLYNDQGTQTVYASHVYVNNWVEGSEDGVDVSGQDYTTNITWNNQPCGVDFDNSDNCNLTAESFISDDGTLDGTWQCWEVGNAVYSEYDSNNDNVSFILYTEDLGNPDLFYSKEYLTDTTLIPYLNITYYAANSAPSISLVEPQNQLYTYNESLDLNFSVSDSDGNLDSCWYTLDSGVTNTTLVSCANTTFDIAEGSYTLWIYANDSFDLSSSDSVNFDVDTTGVSVSISEPSGTKTSRTGILISYTAIGDDLFCWYNVKTSIGGDVIENTTLEDCDSSSFDVATDGDYILNLFLNNSFGNSDSDNSSFSVDTSIDTPVDTGDGSSGGGGGGSSGGSSSVLGLTEISDLIVTSGDSKSLSLKVKNQRLAFLEDCKVIGDGLYSGWVSSNDIKGLAGGQSHDFSFDLNVPDSLSSGIYSVGLKAVCEKWSAVTKFNIEILEKELGFNLVKVERISKDQVKVIYSLEELSGIEQNVELQFLLLDSTGEKVAEIKESLSVGVGSVDEYEVLISIDEFLDSELSLLVNLNSETYSTFVQENIILGAPLSGFSVFGNLSKSDNLISIILGVLFLGFAIFMVWRILRHRKKIRKRK